MVGVKIVESTRNIHRKSLSRRSSFILLQVIHQGNEFWMAPKELELLPNMGVSRIDKFEIVIVVNHLSSSDKR